MIPTLGPTHKYEKPDTHPWIKKNKKREERKVRMSPNRGDMNARAIREDEVERMGPKEAAAPQTNNQMFCPTDFLKEV